MSTDNLTGTLSTTGILNGTFGTSGASGTSNYNDLVNKPQINGNTLEGNKTPAQLGINIPDMTNYYNKSETDSLLDGKADTSDLPDMSNYYNKSETDSLLDEKVDTTDFDATNLPIQSGSSTNTKDYIDTVDSKIPTFDSNTLSGGTSITINRSQIYKYGKLAFVTCVFTTTASITGDSTVLNLPAGYTAKNFTDIVGSDNSGNTKLLYASGNTIKINGSLTSGAVVFLNATYQLA